MNTTAISWAERTWNPTTGCTPVSEGCAHCYAKRMANRLRGRCGYPEDQPFKVTLHPDRLDQPLRMRKPARIFVDSMGDLFHPSVPFWFIDEVWLTITTAKQHIFMVLTKYPGRLLEWTEAAATALDCPAEQIWPSHVYLGVSAENQERAEERIPTLLRVPAAVHFVSLEPLLGPVSLSLYLGETRCCRSRSDGQHCNCWYDGKTCHFCGEHGSIDWVVCGGETGPGARPVHPDWIRAIRDQCKSFRTAFHFKAWGDWAPHPAWTVAHRCEAGQLTERTFYKGRTNGNIEYHAVPRNAADDVRCIEVMKRVGRKQAGRLLDGREWNEYPAPERDGALPGEEREIECL